MGVYTEITNSSCKISKDNLDEAYKLLCELNNENKLKSGGRYSSDIDHENIQDHPVDYRWFAWMDWNYHETCKDAIQILEMLGFHLNETNDAYWLEEYNSKTGDEEIFLDQISHLLCGSIEWEDEYNTRYKWVFSPGEKNKAEYIGVVDWLTPDEAAVSNA